MWVLAVAGEAVLGGGLVRLAGLTDQPISGSAITGWTLRVV